MLLLFGLHKVSVYNCYDQLPGKKNKTLIRITLRVLSTNRQKIPAGNSTYAHAHDFTVSNELLLPILKAFIPQYVTITDDRLSCVKRTLNIFKSPVI
jgi:hypothetical protein